MSQHPVTAAAPATAAAASPVVGKLNDRAYIRWLKATRALNWTIDVLRNFCDTEMKKLHQAFVGRCGGTLCSGPCSSSDAKYAGGRWTINCPNNVCSKWLTEVAAWRTKSTTRLTLSNADIRQWPLQSWQVAKTYMGKGQGQSSVNSSDTDASGIIQLITNCKHFANIVDTTKADAVRLKRNDLMHSKTMKLAATELSDIVQTMCDVLQDHYQRHSDPAAQQAVKDIQQIEKVVIDINDKVFLDNERNAWKQVLASQSLDIQQQSLDIQQQSSDIQKNKTDILQNTTAIIQLMRSDAALKTRLQDVIDQTIGPLEREVETLLENDQHHSHQISQLQERVTNLEATPQNITESLKKQMREKFTDSEKHDTLDEKFVELRLQKSQLETLPETLTYRDVEELERRRRSSTVVSLSQLFSRLEDDKIAPKKVLIRGRAGVGKTTLVEYIAREWATKNFWPDVDYAFVMKLREFSQDEKWSLSDLLLDDLQLSNCEKSAALGAICQHSERVLFLVDGLDECAYYRYSKCKCPSTSKADLSKMISSIISCSLVPKAKVVVTSRPTNQIPSDVFDRVVDVYGFTRHGISQYVDRFCAGNKELGQFILTKIESNPNMATFCHTPVQCHFVCRSLEDMHKHSESGSGLDMATMTQLYVKATHRLGRKLHPSLKYDNTDPGLKAVFRILKEPFLKHAALAKDCMTNPLKIIFYDDDLDQHEFNDEDKQSGFLTGSKKTDPDDRESKVNSWSFSHLSLQDFFAAIGLLQCPCTDVWMLLENDNFVKQYEIVITFMSGLLGDPGNAYYLEYLGLTNASLDCKDFIKKLKGKFENDPLKMVTFIYETQCKDMVDNVPEEIKSKAKIYPMEMLSLCWVVVQDTCRITSLDLGNSGLDIHLVKQLSDALRCNSTIQKLQLDSNAVFAKEDAGRSLGAALVSMPQLRELEMWACHLKVKSWCHIANGISKGCNQMKRLILDRNYVFAKEEAGQLLGATLASTSKLCELKLFRCHITLNSLCRIVGEISRGCPDMKLLTLGGNDVFAKEDAGRSLGSALASMSQLCELVMFNCHLTLESWRHIIGGIARGCPRLEQLDLGENAVFAEEEAGKLLGEALASNSQLRELKLNQCHLTLESWLHITRGIAQYCPHMTHLYCRLNFELTDDSEESFKAVLDHLPRLKICAGGCDLSDECEERLEAEFGWRFEA